ncbi:quinone oxidoreductase family protein [Streptomyces sp. S465]|uniref:quinone oxidoreductase family protein n=1 Tax=Streptomyces sp. S465 TaxID=2979468 RepID=UPI0022A83C69|nr:zinc-binding dehydrogenase [Streptomyces sp. S465]WAP53750.1 zinc-binding dehydrogenase [Streptomyces sp. S465]
MKAVVVRSSAELAVVDAPEPVPGRGQVLVDVDAIGAGYVDVMARRGEYAYFPGVGSVPGLEVVGRVAAVGPDVPEGLVGRRVLALPAFGGYAEKVVAEADRVLAVPGSVDAVDAVAAGVNAMVAEIALHRVGATAGDRVLVRGAGGGIGVLATQIARARGAEVTAVTSAPARGARLRDLGAAHIVDRTRPATAGSDDDCAPAGETYDVVVDTVAGPDLADHLALLRPNGRYILCGGAGGAPEVASLEPLLRDFHRSPTLFAFSLNSVAPEDLALSWKRIVGLLEEGRLSAVIDRRFPLTEADAALRWVESGKPFGKVVLLPR